MLYLSMKYIPSKNIKLTLFIILLAASSALGYIQGKILSYDGENINYNIFYPDYDREYNAGESVSNLQIRFLVYWEYKNGKQERQEYSTDVDIATNTSSDFRYHLVTDLSNIRVVTINLFVANRLSDTFVTNIKPAMPEH